MRPLRKVAADGLRMAAAALAVTSRVVEQGAELLRGGDGDDRTAAEPMPWDRPAPRAPFDEPPAHDDTPPGPLGPVDVDEEREQPDAAGAVEQPPVAPQPVLDDDARVRSPDTHAAELAARPAAEVVAAVEDLSTDELRALYEEESSGKKRKTVLTAVEQALSP